MIHQTDAPVQSSLRLLSVLVFHLLLTHCCRGQSQLIGPPQPIVATVGDDIILPCHLKPAKDVTAEILEWKRSDQPIFVLVWRDSQDLTTEKNPSYRGRTSVFIDELKQGNISLKLLKVQLSDQGTFECDIPLLDKRSSVQLVVGAASSPVLTLAGVDETTSGVVLQCESTGWYPEPEVLWLDGEGHVLSAGPAETVRGPDDLYSVSSRVTVEKRHSNSFTCRVQQNHINQSRETHIHVPDDFFQLQSSCGVPIITALSVSLAVCILIILLLLFFVWKQKQNKNKTKRDRGLEAEMKGLKGEEEKKSKHLETSQGKCDSSSVLKSSESEEQDNPGSANQSPTTGPVIVDEIHRSGRYIRLKNTSHEEERLEGWELHVKVNDTKPIKYNFDNSFKLDAGKTVTMWDQFHGCHHPPSDLKWSELKSWTHKDKLHISLYSHTGEIQHQVLVS